MSGFDAAQWEQISPLIDLALELPDSERAAWLVALRRDRPALATDLECLLDEHRKLSQEWFLDPSSPAATIGRVVGSYTIVAPLGAGGMGSVWLAERSDGRFTRRAAVKFPRVALAAIGGERFHREGSILGRLTHPHVAQLLDAGVTPDGQPYLILEHVDGEPIDRYCEDRALDAPARIRLIIDVLAAVSHAHANLIVHRDLKPTNVLVTTDGCVKLLDFGIAKLLNAEGLAAAATQLTREAGSALTPAYAAPEQLTGGDVTTATDVYAVGVLLYVLLTGRHPAGDAARSPGTLIKAIVDEDLERHLHGDIGTIAYKALQKDPRARYRSADAFADDLRRFLRHEPVGARPDSLAYRARKFVRRNRVAAALAGVALAAVLAGVAATLVEARTARAQRDFALHELARAESINGLNQFVLSDAAPSGERFTVDDLLSRAARIIERQPSPSSSRAELLIALGRQYTVQDEYTKARQLLEQAYTLARSASEPTTHARAACGLAQVVAITGDTSRASALIDEGLGVLPSDPALAGDRVDCLMRAAEVAKDAGNDSEAVARAESALALARQLPSQSDLRQLEATMTAASAYAGVGRNRDAAAQFERAAARLTALGRDGTHHAATVFNNWAITLYQAGLPLAAEPVFRRAIRISQDGDSEATVPPLLLINYGRTLLELGDLDRAADYVARGCEKARAAGANVIVDQGLLVQAAIERSRGDLDSASRTLAEAAARIAQHVPPGHIGLGALAFQEAQLAAARGDRETAIAKFDTAVAIAQRSMEQHGQGAEYLERFLVRRAEAAREMNRAQQAETDARRVLDLAQRAGSGPSILTGEAHLALGRTLAAERQLDGARPELQRAAADLLTAAGPDNPDARQAQRLTGR